MTDRPKSSFSHEKMITVGRAEYVARALFPEDYASGADCRAEEGRIGEPCRICGARNLAWAARIAQVRAAMIGAFQ